MKSSVTTKSKKNIVIASIAVITTLMLLISVVLMTGNSSIPIESFTGNLAMNHINELTKDIYDGRMVGSKGNGLAVEYIKGHFKELGLKPAFDEGYTMAFRTVRPILLKEPYARIDVGNGQWKGLTRDVNFKERIDDYSGSGEINSEIIYISNYLELQNSTGDKLENKIVLIDYSKFPEVPYHKVDYYVHMRRAAGLIYLESKLPQDNIQLGDKHNVLIERKIVKMGVTKDIFDELYKAVVDNQRPRAQLGLFVDFEPYVLAENVVGYIPGQGAYSEEVLILAANFDGLGKDYNGDIYQGANKNASAMGVLMELASLIANNDKAPRKTIAFAAFNGSELGYVGSSHFAYQNVFPKYRTKVINLDSLGGDSSLLVSETFKSPAQPNSPALADTVSHYIKNHQPESQVNLMANGEHIRLIFNRIPAITVRGIESNQLGRMEDTIDRISPQGLQKSGRIILDVINNQVYKIKTLPYFLHPLVKTLPFILILIVVVVVKEMILRGKLKEKNPIIKFIKDTSFVTIWFAFTALVYLYSLQAYFAVQRDLGLYIVTGEHYTYRAILDYAIHGIFPVSLVIFSQSTAIVIPILGWVFIYFFREKEMPIKVFATGTVLILLITDFFIGNRLSDPAAMYTMPEILRTSYQQFIVPIVISIVTGIGALLYYLENRHKDISIHNALIIFVALNILLMNFHYGTYFASKTANELRGLNLGGGGM